MRTRVIDDLRQDVRHSVRTLLNRPGFTLTAVLLLTLAIAANAALFGFIDALIFSAPAHVADPARLVRASNSWLVRYDSFAPLQGDVRLLSLAAQSRTVISLPLESGANAQVVQARFVSHNYLPVLGTQLILGRNFSAAEDADPGASVVILGHALWQRRFAGAPDVTGRTVRLSSRLYTVIGVAPEGFSGVDAEPVDVWLPAGSRREIPAGYSLLGRLASGVAIAQARAELQSAYPPLREAPVMGPELQLAPVHEDFVTRASKLHLLLICMLGAGLVLLLIACTNVSSMIMSHAFKRRQELAIRMQLGAGRGRLVRQLFTEILVMAGVCCLVALAAVHWITDAVLRVLAAPIPGEMGSWIFPRLLFTLETERYGNAILNPHVLAATACFTLLCAVVCVVSPALYLGKADLSRWLKAHGGVDPLHSRLRTSLVVLQVSLTILLLISAGLFVRSFTNAATTNLGIDDARVLVATIPGIRAGYQAADVTRMLEEASRSVRSLPQVTHVSSAGTIPQHIAQSYHAFEIPGFPWPSRADRRGASAFTEYVSPEYFETLGMKIIQGRRPTETQGAADSPVVVVNEWFARDYFRGANPLGHCVKLWGIDNCWTIVAIVSGVRKNIVPRWGDATEEPGIYVVFPKVGGGAANHLLIRTQSDPGPLMGTIRRLIQNAAPNMPYVTLHRLFAYRDQQIHGWRATAALFGAFGILALIVAVGGAYASLSFAVRQRTHEIGVRLAVGAGPRDIMRLVLGTGLRPVAVGVGVGTAATVGAARMMSSMLFGVTPTDPVTVAGVTLFVVAAAAAACIIPARHAARIDPAISLRAE